MKLFWSNASPYSRKVRAVIIEKGLEHSVEAVSVDVFSDPPELIGLNPLGKIPTMVTDEGVTLFDSPVICAYLDIHHAGRGGPMIPLASPERWHVMRTEALGDGIMDLGLALMDERRKPEGEKSPTLAARHRGQLERALDETAGALASLPGAVTLGHLAIACALGYLDLRHDDLQWRHGRNALAAWYEDMIQRPSLARTAPE